ncbi:MAG: helix-turn-helix transcriptional regulator [Thaumarchaeota archaeon]|nr:helix-turn-helix transcriptional regulator [Nitrososphaerota archaeon]
MKWRQDLQPGTALKVSFESCPVLESMGVLGRKWALIVIRNIAFYHKQRFNDMIRFTPGLSRRTLALRLKELQKEGLIEVVERRRNSLKWGLTPKGRDVLPVLMTLAQFGVKWHADAVFSDKTSRSLRDVFTDAFIQRYMESPAYSVVLKNPQIQDRK